MNLDFRVLLGLWALLAVSVIVLVVWRKTVAREEDDQVHMLHTEAVPHQVLVAHKLEVIDKWGKVVTALTIAYGVIIAALFIYQTWVQSSTTVPGA